MMTLQLAPQRIVCLTEETTEWLYLLQNELHFGPHLMTATLERREGELEKTAVGPNRTRTQNAVALSYD